MGLGSGCLSSWIFGLRGGMCLTLLMLAAGLDCVALGAGLGENLLAVVSTHPEVWKQDAWLEVCGSLAVILYLQPIMLTVQSLTDPL